ncbi:ankyrin repeat-containing domain protein [Aspergillus keveii]|uniref:Ankyrin repeat-containing domain protein n=1 Tax=Aspergillus keveii TaxID=714993 RepID=A0ABR4GQI8_9EURO
MPGTCCENTTSESRKSLLCLPDELLLCIGEELSPRSLNALIRTSRRLYFTLRASIYTAALREHGHTFNLANTFKSCARTGNLTAIKNLKDYLESSNLQHYSVKYGWFPVAQEAASHGHGDVLRFLLDLDVSCDPWEMGTLMSGAIANHHVKVVEALIDAGFDVSSPRDLFYCPLTQAAMAYDGDPTTVQLLCERGAYKYATDDDGEIVLHRLARHGFFDMIQFFLDLGILVDAQDIDGKSPLFLAIEGQHHSSVALLLSRGASVSIRDGAGFNPLHWACMQQATSAASIIRLLLDHGADPNERSGTNKTPLHLATSRGRGGDRDSIKVLLAAGADCRAIVDENDNTTPLQNVMAWGYHQHPNISLLMDAGAADNPMQNFRTMIVLAIRHGLFDFAKKLISSGLDPEEMPIFLAQRPLIEAACPGHEEMLKYLLTKIHDVNWKSPAGDTALMRAAASHAGPETIQLLLLHNAHADSTDSRGWIALMYAARFNTAEVTAMILQATAHPQVADFSCNTALHHAIECQKEDNVDLLLKHGFSPAESAAKVTTIEWAVCEGNPSIVQSLLNYSVDPETKNTQGDTLLIEACKLGHHAVADVLLKAGANPNAETQRPSNSYPHARTALCIACYKTNANLVRLLLAHGADAQGAPHPSQTPLGIAASKGHAEIVQLLLIHGAGVNSSTGTPHLRFTALINAAQACHLKTIELLLAQGASISHMDYYGRTALSHAASRGDLDVIKALLAAGAQVDEPDCKGRTPLSWAVMEARHKAADFLIQAGAVVTRPDKEGLTPISLAMRSKDEDMIRILYQ